MTRHSHSGSEHEHGSQGNDHRHDHRHDHQHDDVDLAATPVLDPSIAGSGTPVAAAGIRTDDTTADRAVPGDQAGRGGLRFQWLARDHHIHTQYSSGAQYRVLDQVRAARLGLRPDWRVITTTAA